LKNDEQTGNGVREEKEEGVTSEGVLDGRKEVLERIRRVGSFLIKKSDKSSTGCSISLIFTRIGGEILRVQVDDRNEI